MTHRKLTLVLALSSFACAAEPARELEVRTSSPGDKPGAFEFQAVVDPAAGTIQISPASTWRGLQPGSVVQDGVPGSGPAGSLELVTTNISTDPGVCGMPSAFCADVAINSFYGGPLDSVFAELTSITPAAGHTGLNSDAPVPGTSDAFGLWGYGTIAGGGGGTRQWVFGDDGTAWTFRGRVVADLCSNGVQDGDETGVDCGGSECASCVMGNLVINEVDYDNAGTDTTEFIELVNATGAAVSLANLALVLVSGADNLEYDRILLSGSLAPGGFAVVCPQGVAPATCDASIPVGPGALIINFAGTTNQIQNGAPDAIGLVDLGSGTMIDALSYEGSVTAGIVTGVGTFDFTEGGSPATVADSNTGGDSMQRSPNGSDTNDPATDWTTAPATPGAPNI